MSWPAVSACLCIDTLMLIVAGLVWRRIALWRESKRRWLAETALREQIAVRTAMENSLITGLRASDLDGRITYVNPAFAQMVGMKVDEIVGRMPPMPYWAPEAQREYQQRYAQVLAGNIQPQGFEAVFQHTDGRRIPVLIRSEEHTSELQ